VASASGGPKSPASDAVGSRCGADVPGALGLCVRCGQPLPDNTSEPRYVVVRRAPARPLARREAQRLLANAAPGLGPDEAERQLRALLVRLEAITGTLCSVRQRVVESYVVAEADAGGQTTDDLVAALRREQEVVSGTVAEMERLDRRMADVALE
jgi:hypothetical protein